MASPFTGQAEGVVKFTLTAAEWTAQDRVLADNEVGIESDTGNAKWGDGATAWTSLGYFTPDNSEATAAELDRFNDVSAYVETVIAAGALSVSKKVSNLALVGAGAVTLAAPDGTMLGQIKVIEQTVDNGDVTLALTNVVGQSSGTTATFGDVADKLILVAAATKWVVIAEVGVALA